LRLMEAQKGAFKREILKRIVFPWVGSLIPYRFWKNSKSLFILSSGRTGSLSTVKLLNLSPQIEAYHEPFPRLRRESKSAYYEHYQNLKRYQQLFIEARGLKITYSNVRNKIYAEATYMIYLTELIAELLPNSKFLHLYRHPAAFVRSGMRRGWYRPHLFDEYRLEPSMNDPIRKHWDSWPRFSKILWVWQAVNEYILKLKERIDRRRFLSVKHEDLVLADTEKYKELFAFLGVPCPLHKDVCSLLSVKHNAQSKGEFHRFKEWTCEEKFAFKEIAGNTMEKLGYKE
jgi:hypothetical protein